MTESVEPPEAPIARDRLASGLQSVRPLVTMSRDGLVLIALTWKVDPASAYESATSAAAHGDLELHEQGGGTVPTIEAITKDQPVVIFAGDTIVGGRQNRTINVSVWLKPSSATAIPVSCLEAGRWNVGSRFEASRKVDYRLRSRMSAQVEQRTRAERATFAHDGAPERPRRASYAADQGAIWAEIAAKQARASLDSPTGALHDLYHARAGRPCLGRRGVPVSCRSDRPRGRDRRSNRRARAVRLGGHVRGAVATHRRECRVGLF